MRRRHDRCGGAYAGVRGGEGGKQREGVGVEGYVEAKRVCALWLRMKAVHVAFGMS